MTPISSSKPALQAFPMDTGFGAHVRGPALEALLADPEAAARVKRLLSRHRALVLSGLHLDANELVTLASALGVVRPARVQHPSLPAPAGNHLFVSARSRSDAPPAATPDDAGHVWHIDYTFVYPLPKLSMLYAVKAPKPGSRTWFADMASVYAALPDTLKCEIAGLKACHYSHPHGASVLPDDAVPVSWEKRQQGVHHALVMDDDDGLPLLCLPARRDTPIVGWDEPTSRALLDTLWPYVESHGRVWDYELEAGELLVWDNRALLHKRSEWPITEERLLWFLTTQ